MLARLVKEQIEKEEGAGEGEKSEERSNKRRKVTTPTTDESVTPDTKRQLVDIGIGHELNDDCTYQYWTH